MGMRTSLPPIGFRTDSNAVPVVAKLGWPPMIMETSRQAKTLIPMAISIGFGSIFATLITLILIPSLYVVIDDVRRKFR